MNYLSRLSILQINQTIKLNNYLTCYTEFQNNHHQETSEAANAQWSLDGSIEDNYTSQESALYNRGI